MTSFAASSFFCNQIGVGGAPASGTRSVLFGDLVAVAEHGRNDCRWRCADELTERDDAGRFCCPCPDRELVQNRVRGICSPAVVLGKSQGLSTVLVFRFDLLCRWATSKEPNSSGAGVGGSPRLIEIVPLSTSTRTAS